MPRALGPGTGDRLSPTRWDPFTGDPVLLSPARALRPHDVGPRADPAAVATGCPFCVGNEAATPPEVAAVRAAAGAPDTPGWHVRAFPNKFPALPAEEGVHEIVVNAPRHVTRLVGLSAGELAGALSMWRERIAAVAADRRGLWPFVFLNEGAAAGASLAHSHAQVMGLPLAPPRLRARERALAEPGTCPICADLDVVGHDGGRLVAEADGLVAWSPEVPPLSGTLRLAPARHEPAWDARTDLPAVARFLREVLGRLDAALGVVALNLWLHQRRPSGPERHHWHLELVPRLGTLAGLELGAGVVTVNLLPEDLAGRLRAARGRAGAGEPPALR